MFSLPHSFSATKALEMPVLTFTAGPTNSMRGAAVLSRTSARAALLMSNTVCTFRDPEMPYEGCVGTSNVRNYTAAM